MTDSTKKAKNRQEWKEKTGRLPFRMTNDYLFKALAQKDEEALKDLISACLHMEKDRIDSLEITNPIQLGEFIDEKDFILDVKVIMNNDTTVDLEMQVINHQDWPERSLQYLCRNYDSLRKGENYLNSGTAIHVGILDFMLHGNETAFHESYRLMEIHSHKVYTDKFQLFIISLPGISLASEEDRQYHTDLWGRFFRAKSWEELNMLAEENEAIAAAASTVFQLVADEKIRMQLEAREDYYRRQRTEELIKQRLTEALEKEKKKREESDRRAEESNRRAEDAIRQAEESNRRAQKAEEESRRLKEELIRLRSQGGADN